MRFRILAYGRMGNGPEAELVKRYATRMGQDFSMSELREGASLPYAPAGDTRLVVLDERGRNLGSVPLAQRLREWRDQGVRECAFAIGPADGFSDAQRDRADLVLSFGAATWPHMLLRAMLTEQLYRAQSILSGHPYHRV